jgi:hydrogenase maturation protein HypF
MSFSFSAGELMIRVRIEIGGIVQGVGFRPFIHKLVNEYGLSGWVKNTSFGVEIELEGLDKKISGSGV